MYGAGSPEPGPGENAGGRPVVFFPSVTCNATCERLLVVEPKKLLKAFLLVETGKT